MAHRRFGVRGITIFAASSESNLLWEIGLATELESLLSYVDVPKWLMAIAIDVIIILIAMPLTASATMAAIGPVTVMTMASAGIADVNPRKTFTPLLKYYCVPPLGIGTLIVLEFLPV
ncbi:hypothetical protein [Brevibacterium aurantiacum]|uniref:TRAP C4-dicarboxylate transport system permease DctM subunit domain-containing protein n=1 Tax=Brevibacterium aurantiacum TaxID=273384 RepID=A0A556CC01_BREAU|nr:hypothetical protein [Brevibacterium aurantiacum]TSI14568.1 hypothetical protein FO013_14495 [Brevibacterium aurantiacum]